VQKIFLSRGKVLDELEREESQYGKKNGVLRGRKKTAEKKEEVPNLRHSDKLPRSFGDAGYSKRPSCRSFRIYSRALFGCESKPSNRKFFSAIKGDTREKGWRAA